MPNRRLAFSLIELLITLSILVVLASAAWQYLGEDPVKAQYFRAKAELKRLQTRVQAACLSQPGYHFDTLEEALGVDEPVLDPWGRAYQLTHNSGTGREQVADIADAQEQGIDQQAGPDCGGGNFHSIQSGGPRNLEIPNFGPGEDLQTLLAIRVSLGTKHKASPQVEAPRIDSVRVSSNEVLLRVFRVDPVDAGQITLELNGVTLSGTINLAAPPGSSHPLTLSSGPNVLKVVALFTGPQGSTKVGLQVERAMSGTPAGQLDLIPGAEGFWEIVAP